MRMSLYAIFSIYDNYVFVCAGELQGFKEVKFTVSFGIQFFKGKNMSNAATVKDNIANMSEFVQYFTVR